MKRMNWLPRRLEVLFLSAAALLNCSIGLAQVSPTAPPPDRNITAPGPQRHQPPAQPEKQLPGTRAPQPIRQTESVGTIEGFVYWDANAIAHKPADSCSGLAITVSVGSSSGGPLTAYTALGTLSNNFKYVGQVKEFLAGGKINVYAVCTYGFSHVPVGPNLQVKLTVTDPFAYSPYAVPESTILGPIQIVNGQCASLPRIVNPNASDLLAHWGTCQNMAFDVNFPMQVPVRVSTGASGTTPVGSGGQAGMLSGAPQQGMLAPGTTQGASSGTLLGKRLSTPGQGGGVPDPASKVELNPQPLPPRVQMTNADVLKMLKGRVPESVNISSIQSAAHKFDFSPARCLELKAAHVTRQVLDAMGDGGVRPCPAIQGNTAQRAGVRSAVLNLGAPKSLQKITNPRLAEQSAGILAVLQQQQQAAQQESAEMKLNLRPAITTASLARVPAAAGFKGGAPAQPIGPETVQGAQGNLSSSITHPPSLNTTVLTCSYDTTPRILQVSGGQSHGVFTPEAKYNLYTIVGCNFGQSQSGNSAYIFGANGFKANLNIDYWSDNGITAHLDPYLAGVLDQSTVTLVVAPAGKQQLQKSGFQFYAARGMPALDGSDQEVQLSYNSLPQSNVDLAYSTTPIVIGWNQVPSNAQSQFPSFSFSGTPIIDWVFRYAYGHEDPNNPCFINDVHYPLSTCQWYFSQNHPGIDNWDFSKLAPGFAISSYNLYYETTDPSKMCGAWDDEASGDRDGQAGQWDFKLSSQNRISVVWPLYYCHDEEEFSSRVNKQVLSSYGLAVWVLGPRCVDPWSGQKDQACVDQIRKMFS